MEAHMPPARPHHRGRARAGRGEGAGVSIKTESETLKDYIDLMGPELGSMFCALQGHVAHLHEKWGQYLELFAKSEEQIQMLNRAASGFFGTYQRLLWDDIVLSVARINDNATTAGKTNLTLSGLVKVIKNEGLKTEAGLKAERAKQASSFCRDWRNRKIAHTDLKLAIQETAEPLAEASRQKVRAALSAIADVMNEINSYFHDSTIVFDEDWGAGNAEELLYVVNDGLHLNELRLSFVRSGRIVPDDLRPKKIGS
jgi:hypothetical protein